MEKNVEFSSLISGIWPGFKAKYPGYPWFLLLISLLYKMGRDFLDIQYNDFDAGRANRKYLPCLLLLSYILSVLWSPGESSPDQHFFFIQILSKRTLPRNRKCFNFFSSALAKFKHISRTFKYIGGYKINFIITPTDTIFHAASNLFPNLKNCS